MIRGGWKYTCTVAFVSASRGGEVVRLGKYIEGDHWFLSCASVGVF
jgi:hypothetical protein